jgi:hypothetical protein
MQIQSVRQLKIPTVATKPAQQRVLGDQRASFTGEQIKPVRHTRPPVSEPVGDHLSSPLEHRQDATPLRRGSLLGLAVAHLHNAIAAELASMGIAGEIHRLQMAQFVETKP